MLKLIFHAGDRQYAVSCTYVKRVVPQVKLTNIPHSPDYVLGMMNLNGKPTPVIDFCLLVDGIPARDRFHTRIILLDILHNGRRVEFGLVAEAVTDTLSANDETFVDSTVRVDRLSFVKGSMMADNHIVQLVDVPNLVDLITKEGALAV
ncbi:MAG: chemotaxis protein CheW [Chlamydiales bacterium]|nr:chemotaxis protein CheW [Chlamydiia bacterium]MCP5508332.1 chemotaxis protein CheW [Chlamydiales bacterium]